MPAPTDRPFSLTRAWLALAYEVGTMAAATRTRHWAEEEPPREDRVRTIPAGATASPPEPTSTPES